MVGGATNEPHALSMHDWPLGQQPPPRNCGHWKEEMLHARGQQEVDVVAIATAGGAVIVSVVAREPGSSIVVVIVLIHKYCGSLRSGHWLYFAQSLPILQHATGYEPLGSVAFEIKQYWSSRQQFLGRPIS